ncbi:NAD(P)H-hydrate epimerase [Gracilariopsis chorda]|uniref:NAD(P)H-hydrate epimerase n=1 Tax=Gracilariopsis chorda TaxID=448386 RepID=A0A2V3J2W7_9FLOR|nr:NAD(P)H-hydrate epimerase [Gracilariopsis chorda]|eukprot:PXF48791.1 NAD(P)H-hydrate epimerase [Gracilariopsis chorda]
MPVSLHHVSYRPQIIRLGRLILSAILQALSVAGLVCGRVNPYSLSKHSSGCYLMEAVLSFTLPNFTPGRVMAAFLQPQPVPGLYRHSFRQHNLCRRRLVRFSSSRTLNLNVRMLSDTPGQQGQGGENAQSNQPNAYVTPEVAQQAMIDAIALAGDDVQRVAELCAIGFVEALTQCYKVSDAPAVFVVCGPGLTGLIGVYTAIKLKEKGYDPAVHFSHPSKYVDKSSIRKKYDIPVYEFVPTTLEFYFQVIVDALLGVGFDGGDIHAPYWQVFEMLISTRRPIASIDVPSGWDLTTGPRPIDRTAATFIKPELLVSLGAPKLCSKMFAGAFHFVAGLHLPQSYFEEKGISVPVFPGDSHTVLLSSSPFQFTENGEAYGKPGQFNATLYTKNPRRQWVDIDDDMDLWDELD